VLCLCLDDATTVLYRFASVYSTCAALRLPFAGLERVLLAGRESGLPNSVVKYGCFCWRYDDTAEEEEEEEEVPLEVLLAMQAARDSQWKQRRTGTGIADERKTTVLPLQVLRRACCRAAQRSASARSRLLRKAVVCAPRRWLGIR
jgi:hypothetical protein